MKAFGSSHLVCSARRRRGLDLLKGDTLRRHELQVWFLAEHPSISRRSGVSTRVSP